MPVLAALVKHYLMFTGLSAQLSCLVLTYRTIYKGPANCLWDDSRASHSVASMVLFLPLHVSSVAAFKPSTITELSSCGREHMVCKA